jgi:hypothetical protein
MQHTMGEDRRSSRVALNHKVMQWEVAGVQQQQQQQPN